MKLEKVSWRWKDPANPLGNSKRIDRVDSNSPWDSQKVDHVVIISNGVFLDRNGRVVESTPEFPLPSKSPDIHIPLEEWETWSHWNSP